MNLTVDLGKKGEAVVQRYLQISSNNSLAIGILLSDGTMGNAKGRKSANVHYIAKLLYSEIKRHHISVIG